MTGSTPPATDRRKSPWRQSEAASLEFELMDLRGQVAAINKSQLVVQFDLNGNILDANANFLETMGYRLDEILGRHHRLFVDSDYAASAAYRAFWASLNAGDFRSGEMKRLARNGDEVWLQATYTPILDASGIPFKVVKFASDITATKLRNANHEGQLDAIGKSQMVVEFDLQGAVLTANDNFLAATGYRLEELRGRHHSQLVNPEYARSAEYTRFWNELRQGRFQAGEFRRVGKGGRELWLQATYTPILDPSGQPFKVVKYATAIDEQVRIIRAVRESATALATAARELLVTSQSMGGSAARTSELAASAATATRQVTQNVRQVAESSEKLAASSRGIATSAGEAARVAGEAVRVAGDADGTVNRLGESGEAIGQVIKVISTIAAQTNLLALNASIEAARAGEVGRGFAVVANEVKELAKQAGSATGQIGDRIETLQADTHDAVDALRKISTIIGEIDGIQSRIADSVQSQSATTGDIRRNAGDAATGAGAISASIQQVARMAQTASEGSSATENAASQLAAMAEQLQALVARFKY